MVFLLKEKKIDPLSIRWYTSTQSFLLGLVKSYELRYGNYPLLMSFPTETVIFRICLLEEETQ